MKTKLWIAGWFVIVAFVLGFLGRCVYRVDPYFHFHKPNTDRYYYPLNNQRSQNDGIGRHFDYDALITGSSMTENFKTSEFDELFKVHSVKVSYSGGSYREINNNITNALSYNNNLKVIVRGLDAAMLLDPPDRLREDLGEYPAYLYDSNPLNDVNYLFNKDVIFGRVYAMEVAKSKDGFVPGITSFDDYARWQDDYTFGMKTVRPGGVVFSGCGSPVHLSDEEKSILYRQITQNVTQIADKYPETEFYYFFTPYSIIWQQQFVEDGTIYRQIEAEKYAIELILEHPNIKLFSFNAEEDIVTNINHYKDWAHYAEWVNSFILRCMRENRYRLTKNNYQTYLEEEISLFTGFDYESLNHQIDYEDDFYAATLLNADMN